MPQYRVHCVKAATNEPFFVDFDSRMKAERFIFETNSKKHRKGDNPIKSYTLHEIEG